MIEIARVEIQKAKALLRNMPEQANRLIHFLNTHTREQLAALDIGDRTGTIFVEFLNNLTHIQQRLS